MKDKRSDVLGRESAGARRTSFQLLLDRFAEADATFSAAKDGEQKRIAMLLALRAQLEFNQSAKMASAALSALFVDLAGLSVGQMNDVFKKAAGHGLTLSDARRGRDVMIAVAFKLLTEGGPRSGNMSRKEASLFIAPRLKALGVTDGGKNLTGKRVTNIYLETVKKPRPRIPKASISSPMAAAIAIARDRTQILPHIQFNQVLEESRRYLSDALRTNQGRKRVALGFLRAAADLEPS